MTRLLLPSLTLLLAGSMSPLAHALTIQKGAAIEIVIADKASDPEQYAAEELQRALRLTTQVELPITTESKASLERRILIGTAASHHGIAAAESSLSLGLNKPASPEQIVIETAGENTLIFAGATPRAALYATYTFLEEVVGARWFWPGEDGEYLPQRSSIELTQLKIRQSPSFENRGLHICGAAYHHDETTEVWMARNRMNFVLGMELPESILSQRRKRGMLYRFQHHNVTLPKALLEKHPTYLAELNGKRTIDPIASHLCWTNSEVKALIADKVRGWWDASPEIDMLSFYPADHTNYCQCSECTAIGDVSTRWQKFTAEIIAEVNKTHPGKRYSTLAYAGYRPVPAGEVAPYALLEYCLYNRCYRKLFSENDALNNAAIKEMREWKAKGVPMGIYGYEFDLFKDTKFVPLVSYELDQLAFYKKEGFASFFTECSAFNHPSGKPAAQQDWYAFRLPLYAAAKGTWNAGLTPQELVRDWTQHIYGPAALPMEEYYWLMEEAWRKAPGNITYFSHPSASYVVGFISRELLEKAEACFARAIKASASLAEPQRQRALGQIKIEQSLLQAWKDLYTARLGRDQSFQAYAALTEKVPALTPAQPDPRWTKAPKLPPFIENMEKEATDATEVAMLWDGQQLALRFTCHDRDTRQLETKYRGHDEDIWADDCIEIFLDPQGDGKGYMHLAFNAKGARFDARTTPSKFGDVSWNPDWNVATHIEPQAWVAEVALPFSSFGPKVKEGSNWKIAIKRSRPASRKVTNSGWPDEAYHSAQSFGTLHFSKLAPKKKGSVLLYNPPFDATGMTISLSQAGWNVDFSTKDTASLEQRLATGDIAAIFAWYPSGLDWPAPFFAGPIADYLEAGGTLFLSAHGNLPMEKWFPQFDVGVRWSGWEIHPQRRCISLQTGEWSSQPQNLAQVLEGGVTPSSAFEPLSANWEPLANLQMADERTLPFLLRAHVGKGQIILTSSDLGAAGGFEVFGTKHLDNLPVLLGNLLEPMTAAQE